MRPHQGSVEGKENLPHTAGHTLLDAPTGWTTGCCPLCHRHLETRVAGWKPWALGASATLGKGRFFSNAELNANPRVMQVENHFKNDYKWIGYAKTSRESRVAAVSLKRQLCHGGWGSARPSSARRLFLHFKMPLEKPLQKQNGNFSTGQFWT